MSSSRDGKSKLTNNAHKTLVQNDRTTEHQYHTHQHRCMHVKNDDRNPQESNQVQRFDSIAYHPYILLSDQHTRDLTDVYRRDKNIFDEHNEYKPSNEKKVTKANNLVQNNQISELQVCLQENGYAIPCTCHMSIASRVYQNFFNGIKRSLEFFLFIIDVIRHRNEFIAYEYPFIENHVNNCCTSGGYPFMHRPLNSNEIEKLNLIRNQLNKKCSTTKRTTTSTYYDIH